MSEDRLLLRGAASPIGAPEERAHALLCMREDLVRGRLDATPLVVWLGPSVGQLVFEASVRAGLPTRCRARRDDAEEAISCVLDCLERALPMHDLANARGETSIAIFAIEQTLEAAFGRAAEIHSVRVSLRERTLALDVHAAHSSTSPRVRRAAAFAPRPDTLRARAGISASESGRGGGGPMLRRNDDGDPLPSRRVGAQREHRLESMRCLVWTPAQSPMAMPSLWRRVR